MAIFILFQCKTLYFDDHYHAYAISATSNRVIISDFYDFNIFHAHKLSDGQLYIALKYHFLS